MSRIATMAYSDPRDETSPYIPLPAPPGQAPELVGWETAIEYHRLKRILPDARERTRAREAAISAVLERAMACVRHAARPLAQRERAWNDAPEGELDLEASLEADLLLNPDDAARVRVSVREACEADIVLVLDMSLSMTGEKIALVAVAAAVVAFRLPMTALGVVAFDSSAQTLKRLREPMPLRELIRRILEVPARGYTNLEAGLKAGLEHLRDAGSLRRGALLLSDGVYNMGWDPGPLASRFPRLHVIHLGEGAPQDRGLCQRLASDGRGRYFRAERYQDLPLVAYRLVQDLFR